MQQPHTTLRPSHWVRAFSLICNDITTKNHDNKDACAHLGQLLFNTISWCTAHSEFIAAAKIEVASVSCSPWYVCYCSYRSQEANFIVGQKIEYGLDGHDWKSQQRVALIRRWNWLSEWHCIWVQWPNASINPVHDGRHLALRRGGGSDDLTRDNTQSSWREGWAVINTWFIIAGH